MQHVRRSRLAPPLALLALAALCGASAPAAEPARDVPVDDVSYSIGYDLGLETLERLRADGVRVNHEEIAKGLLAALNEQPARLDEHRRSHLLRIVEEEVRRREAALLRDTDPAFRALAEENLRQSKAFHEMVGKEPGVTTMPDGLQYKVVEEGAGEKPGPASTVVVSFRATRIDGSVFASGAMEPVVIGETVPGVQKFVQMMPVGSRWRVAIPPSLAFGDLGLPPDLGPNESILVDVTLHEIRKGE